MSVCCTELRGVCFLEVENVLVLAKGSVRCTGGSPLFGWSIIRGFTVVRGTENL